MHLPQKIARGIDWWLSAPSRALLTWAICSAVTWLAVLRKDWIEEMHILLIGITYRIQPSIPFPLPRWLPDLWSIWFLALFMPGFRPVILRLGGWRTAAWVAASLLLCGGGFSLHAMAINSADALLWMRFQYLIILAPGTSLPALLLLGRRGPFPLVLMIIAAHLLFLILIHLSLLARADPISPHWTFILRALILPDLAFGAALLYGTKPLVRGTSPIAEKTPSIPRDTFFGGEQMPTGGKKTPSGRVATSSDARATSSGREKMPSGAAATSSDGVDDTGCGEEKASVPRDTASGGEETPSLAPGTASGGEETSSVPRDTASRGGES